MLIDLALVKTYSDLHNDLNVAIDNAIDDIITAQIKDRDSIMDAIKAFLGKGK